MSDAPVPVPSTPLNDALIQILHSTSSGVGEAKDFLIAQAPDVIKQFVIFHTVKEWAIVGMGALLLLCALANLIVWSVKKWDIDRQTLQCMGSVFFIVICLMVGSMTLTEHASNALELTFAPKVYLIEAANRLVHGQSP